jgi:hypothetical protein
MIFAQTEGCRVFFHVLGSKHFPTHMLYGPKPVLFEGKLACLLNIYVRVTCFAKNVAG